MSVPKIDTNDLSPAEFKKNFMEKGVPVVLKNSSKVWKGIDLFSFDYFEKNFGDRKAFAGDREYSVKELIPLVKASSYETPAPYPAKYDIRRQMPELLPLLRPLSMNYATPNWFESKLFPKYATANSIDLYFGGPGCRYRLHVDYVHTHAWVTQIWGEKKFYVFPRGQEQFLYPKPDYPWISEIDIYNPDYEKFPKFREAKAMEVIVERGETIFIPAGLWHTTEALTPNIAVIFDLINATNYDTYRHDVAEELAKTKKMKAAAYTAYTSVAKVFCMMGDKIGVNRVRY